MDANQALLLSTIGVSAIYALFAYLIILRITSQPGAAGGTGSGGSGTGGPVPPPDTGPTPVDRFPAAIADTLEWEGGNDDDPRDPGGRTSRGILQREWNVWRQTHPGLPADVWQAPQDQVVAIYRQNYWDAMSCGDLPAGVDYCVFDYGVNSGNSRAASALQNLVGANVDGEIGPDTVAATAKMDPTALVDKLCDQRLAFLKGLGTWGTFGKGWTKRVEGVREQAAAMVGTAVPPATPPTAPTASAPWVTLGRTYNGLVWSGGPMPMQIVAWLDTIAAKFPDEAAYCQTLKNEGKDKWWAWCGAYVRAMLAPYGIKGPISAAGLRGETTTEDWAYVDAWKNWGTKVWGPEDGSINNAQPQVGDVLVWNAPGIHHVSFYGKPLPDTDTFDSLGGDQGKPLRVCEEEIPMSYCVAIRRPPAA